MFLISEFYFFTLFSLWRLHLFSVVPLCCRSVSPVPHKNSPLCPCEKNIFFDPPLQIFLLGFILKLEIQLWNAVTYMARNLEGGDLGNARKKTSLCCQVIPLLKSLLVVGYLPTYKFAIVFAFFLLCFHL